MTASADLAFAWRTRRKRRLFIFAAWFCIPCKRLRRAYFHVMYQHLSVSFTPDGMSAAPLPISAPYGEGLWNVDTLSVVRGWSSQPMYYGSGGAFMNAVAIVLSMTPTRRRTTAGGSVIFEGWAPPGAIRVQRPGTSVASEMFTPFDQVAFYIPTSIFQSILREQRRPESAVFDIVDPLWLVDKVVDANMRSVLAALNRRTVTSCQYISNMARSLASHVLYQYLEDPESIPELNRIGSPQVLRAIEFIDGNIDHSLTLSEIAEATGLPIDKFRREFKIATNLSPHQYVIRRRVDRACELIASTPKPRFAEIALECGFADQSHLSTTFRRVLGVSPARFVRQS